MSLGVFAQSTGVQGVRETLQRMAGLINGAILDATLRDQAARAIAGCPKGHKTCHCIALLNWVNRKVSYVADPQGIETLHDPRIIAQGIRNRKHVYGDCDDLSMYLAALLKSVGYTPTLRAVGYFGKPLSHVYVVCQGMKLDACRDAWTPQPYNLKETSFLELKV